MFSPQTKMLVVDDSHLIRAQIKQILASMGFHSIEEAENGAEAIVKMHEAFEMKSAFDIVFLDWNMPKQSGIETLIEIKATDGISQASCIMVTSESEMASRLNALQSGAIYLVAKPFQASDIRKALEVAYKHLQGLKA